MARTEAEQAVWDATAAIGYLALTERPTGDAAASLSLAGKRLSVATVTGTAGAPLHCHAAAEHLRRAAAEGVANTERAIALCLAAAETFTTK